MESESPKKMSLDPFSFESVAAVVIDDGANDVGSFARETRATRRLYCVRLRFVCSPKI